MPPEQKKTSFLKIVIVAVVAVAIIFVIFAVIGMQKEKGGPQDIENVPTTGDSVPETSTEQEEVSSGAPITPPEEAVMQEVAVEVREPEPISDDTQEKINAVQEKIVAGEITLEEGQKEINKILGI